MTPRTAKIRQELGVIAEALRRGFNARHIWSIYYYPNEGVIRAPSTSSYKILLAAAVHFTPDSYNLGMSSAELDSLARRLNYWLSSIGYKEVI